MTRLWTSQVSKQAPIQGSTCHSSSALAIRNVEGSILRWRFLQASIHLFRANQSRLPRSFHPSLSPVQHSSLTVPPQSAPEQSAAGTATFSTSALAVGTHSISATYSGDSNY